ncbi:MAG: peptide deformylase [Rhodobiaceae bacterium]|nr:peptide deformylase [Rhodobiaceae bacterium]MCC0055115.1 peptide deformylase [Rhodobiaceae bacterium]
MAKREILHIPDSRLREVCAPVEKVDDEVRAILDDMLETMYDAPGIGLAGCQVGVMRRLVVIDVAGREDEEPSPIYLVNPRLTVVSDELSVHQEGCLSIPEYYEDVERPARCTVEFLDRDGKPQVMECEGILATCVQHELDHLDGRLFIDHLSRLKRDRVMKKFSKIDRRKTETVG